VYYNSYNITYPLLLLLLQVAACLARCYPRSPPSKSSRDFVFHQAAALPSAATGVAPPAFADKESSLVLQMVVGPCSLVALNPQLC
jgi:hypothetical protein